MHNLEQKKWYRAYKSIGLVVVILASVVNGIYTYQVKEPSENHVGIVCSMDPDWEAVLKDEPKKFLETISPNTFQSWSEHQRSNCKNKLSTYWANRIEVVGTLSNQIQWTIAVLLVTFAILVLSGIGILRIIVYVVYGKEKHGS